MKISKKLVLLVLHITITAAGAFTLHASDDSNDYQAIRETVPLLTSNEAKFMEEHLKISLVRAIKEENYQAKKEYEMLLHAFYQGSYDMVIAQIKALGENIQDILNVTGLRELLINGTIINYPWFIKDIAELPAKPFEHFHNSYKDKLLYTEHLLETFKRMPMAISHYKKETLDALNILQATFYDCSLHLSGIFLKKAQHDLNDIQDLLNIYR